MFETFYKLKLGAQDNKIQFEGIKAIANTLGVNKTLKILDLEVCKSIHPFFSPNSDVGATSRTL